MNKFQNHRHGVQFSTDRSYQMVTKTIQDEIWSKFCSDTKPIAKPKNPVAKRKFKPHPSKVRSDSDISNCVSPKLRPGWGSDSNINLASPKEPNNNIVTKTKSTVIERTIGDSKANKLSKSTTNVPSQQEPVCKILLDKTKPENRQIENVAIKKSKIHIIDEVDQKFKFLFTRIFMVLEDVSHQMDKGIALPDGEEDFERRKIRSTEFSSRFLRNYLYQLSREINDLQKVVKHNNCCCVSGAHKKLVSSHQIILQALQTYHKHMQTTLPTFVQSKIKELLTKSMYLCELHIRMLNSDKEGVHSNRKNFVQTFQNKIQALVDKLSNYDVETVVTLLKSNSTRVSLAGYKMDKHTNKIKKKNHLKSRLAMYSQSTTGWRTVAAELAKKRLNVQSKYKTATFKHRPIVQNKPRIVTLPTKNRLFGKCSSGYIQATALNSPITDENIVTMIGMEKEKEKNNVENSPQESQANLQGCNSQFSMESKDMSQDQLKSILCNMLGMAQDLNQGKEGSLSESGNGTAKHIDLAHKMLQLMRETNAKSTNNVKKKVSVTEYGPKNARLICIRDDNSIIEPEPEPEQIELQPIEPPPPEIHRVSSETQTDTTHEPQPKNNASQESVTNKESKHTTMSVKISRLPRNNRKQLELLPKELMINVVQYKLEMHKLFRNNPLYKKSSNVTPWLLTGKISDQILDHLLLSVAREIELNEILETLYHSEFQ